MDEIKTLEKEKQEVVQKVKKLDEERVKLAIRLAEIQGVIKYLTKEDK